MELVLPTAPVDRLMNKFEANPPHMAFALHPLGDLGDVGVDDRPWQLPGACPACAADGGQFLDQFDLPPHLVEAEATAQFRRPAQAEKNIREVLDKVAFGVGRGVLQPIRSAFGRA